MTKLICEVFAAAIAPRFPLIEMPSTPLRKAPNTEAKDPGASPCSTRKLAPFTTIGLPKGAAGAPFDRAHPVKPPSLAGGTAKLWNALPQSQKDFLE
jgi:hypothetical protein